MSCDAYPSDIVINRPERTIDMTWDETKTSVSHRALRAACRCTQCESARRKNEGWSAAEEVEIEKVEAVGSVGLQFFFSDGHNRGIYPWPYLYQIAYGRNPLEGVTQ